MSSSLSSEEVKHTICLVDEPPLILAGLQSILADSAELIIVSNTEDTDNALNAIRELTPSMVIFDIAKGDHVSFELGKGLHDHWPGLPWLVLSSRDENVFGAHVIRCGGRGYAMKSAQLVQIGEAIQTVLAGGVWLSRRATPYVLRTLRSDSSAQQPFFDSLNNLELEIFHLLGKGISPDEIAIKLCIGSQIVHSCEARFGESLRMSDRETLVHFARTNRIKLLD